MRRMRLRNGIGACLLVIALVATGCGGDDDESETTAAESTGSAETTTAAETTPAPESVAPCVDAWNASSNSAAQQDLTNAYPGDTAGAVVAGLQDGVCVVASLREGDPSIVVYAQAQGTFARGADVPADQYGQYTSSIGALKVIVQPDGTVEPA